MPMLRCTEPECGCEYYVRSQLAAGSTCEECGGETVEIHDESGPPAEVGSALDLQAHPGHARAKARTVARDHGCVRPPVVVHAIARKLGFTIRTSHRLGTLRARLVDDVIEVNAAEPPVAQRFSVAHELGHHFLNTAHGDGDSAEQEADAFAGELLVPGPMLRAAMETVTDRTQLRGRFKVSRDVLEIAARTHHLSDRLTGT